MHEETFCFKGAVSRNSAKLGNYKMPVKRNVKMRVTQQIQQMPRMGKTEEDLNGLKLGFLKIKTVQPNSFSKLIPAAYNFKNNDKFVFLGSLILSFTCNFFAYFKFHSD